LTLQKEAVKTLEIEIGKKLPGKLIRVTIRKKPVLRGGEKDSGGSKMFIE